MLGLPKEREITLANAKVFTSNMKKGLHLIFPSIAIYDVVINKPVRQSKLKK